MIFDSSPQDFYQVYLIIPETKLSIYEKYDETVGLITFNSKSDNLFTLNRNASINFEIDQITIMSALSSMYYKEFNQLFLALKMNRTNKNKMIDLLKTPIQH